MASVAKTMKTLRGGYTKAEFARVLGVPRSMVTKWEAGTAWPGVASLVRIREVMGDKAALDVLSGIAEGGNK